MLAAERWWDGCDREVRAVEKIARIGSGHPATLLTLECGHQQLADVANTAPGDAAICRECARAKGAQS